MNKALIQLRYATDRLREAFEFLDMAKQELDQQAAKETEANEAIIRG